MITKVSWQCCTAEGGHSAGLGRVALADGEYGGRGLGDLGGLPKWHEAIEGIHKAALDVGYDSAESIPMFGGGISRLAVGIMKRAAWSFKAVCRPSATLTLMVYSIIDTATPTLHIVPLAKS